MFLELSQMIPHAASFTNHSSRFSTIPWVGKDWWAPWLWLAGRLAGLLWEVIHLVHGSDFVCQIWCGQQPAQPWVLTSQGVALDVLATQGCCHCQTAC